jgi:hypothetical protein
MKILRSTFRHMSCRTANDCRRVSNSQRGADNAPLTNFALIQALPRIAESAPAAGYLLEALMAGVAQGDPAAEARLSEFWKDAQLKSSIADGGVGDGSCLAP